MNLFHYIILLNYPLKEMILQAHWFLSTSKIVRLRVSFSNSLVFNTSCHKCNEVNNLCAVESKLPTDLSVPIVY